MILNFKNTAIACLGILTILLAVILSLLVEINPKNNDITINIAQAQSNGCFGLPVRTSLYNWGQGKSGSNGWEGGAGGVSMDVNGDGLQDIIKKAPGSTFYDGGNALHLNTGKGYVSINTCSGEYPPTEGECWELPNTIMMQTSINSENVNQSIDLPVQTDINGDGLIDLIKIKKVCNSPLIYAKEAWINNGWGFDGIMTCYDGVQICDD